MGKEYRHFTLEDRCTIARLREGGQSIRQIAAAMDRAARWAGLRALNKSGGS